METTEKLVQSTEQSQEHCKTVIHQFVYKTIGKFLDGKTPEAYYSETLSEALYNMLHKPDGLIQDWDAAIYEMKDTLQSILVLLGKPGIIDLLHHYNRQDASEHINKMIDFLAWIETDRITALLYLEHLNHYPSQKWVDLSIKHYAEEVAKADTVKA